MIEISFCGYTLIPTKKDRTMAKKYLVIHADSMLQVFDVNTEMKQFLSTAEHYNKDSEGRLAPAVKVELNKFVEGRLNELFPNNPSIDTKCIGTITVYLGVSGVINR